MIRKFKKSLFLSFVLCGLLLNSGIYAQDEKKSKDLTDKEIQEFVRQELERTLTQKGARKAEAEELVISAGRAESSGEYEKAKRLLERAVTIDPENNTASKKLNEIKRYLPSDPSATTSIIAEQERRARVEQMMRLSEVQNLLSNAQKKYDSAEELRKTAQSASDIQKTIDLYNSSKDDLDRSKLKMAGLPASVDKTEELKQAKVLSLQIKKIKDELLAQLEKIANKEAIVQAQNEKHRVEEYKSKQQELLFGRAHKHLNINQFNEASAVLNQILADDPSNRAALTMLTEVKQKQHENRENDLADKAYHERLNILHDLEESAIPRRGYIKYPSNWGELRKKEELREKMSKGGSTPAWKLEIIAKLDQPVSFEFTDAPLKDVLNHLSRQTGINILIGSSAAGGAIVATEGEEGEENSSLDSDQSTITLKVKDMRLENALKWIMTISNLQYEIRDEAIFVGNSDKMNDVWITKVIDVSDINNQISDAPDPRSGSASNGDDDDDLEDAEELNLVDIIKKIAPSTWEEGRGSAEMIGRNSLVVRQTEDVHEYVANALRQLRAAQAIQVAVAARFITVQDNFWQEINSYFPNIANTYTTEEELAANGGRGNFTNRTPPPLDAAGINNKYDSSSATTYGGWGRNYTWVNNQMTNTAINPLVSVLGDTISSTIPGDAGLMAQVIQHGWLGNLETSWILRMLKESNKSDELFAPHLIVYNNKQAWVAIETRVPYIHTYNVAEANGDNPGILEPEIDYAYDGVLLQVRPTVSSDKRYITLDIWAETSRISMNDMSIDNVNAAGDTIAHAYTIDLPTTLKQKTQTFATLPDGGSILISGLGININMRGKNGVPLVSDVPVLGKLFGSRVNQSEKRNYMILINARMLLLDEEEAKLNR